MNKNPRPNPGVSSVAASLQLLAAADANKFWGVQQKLDTAKDGPNYWAVSPTALQTFPRLANICAFTITKNDADAVAAALNRFSQTWAVVRYEPEDTKAGDSLFGVLKSDSPILPIARVLAWAETENAAKLIITALDAQNSNKAEADRNVEPARPWLEKGGARHNYNVIENTLKSLAGRILTILDAAFVNEQHNGAVKKLVKKEIRSTLSDFWNQSFTDDYLAVSEDKPESIALD